MNFDSDCTVNRDKKKIDESKQAESLSRSQRLRASARTFFILLLPGLIAVAAMLPATSMGPTAFAIREDFMLSIAQIGMAYTAFFLASATLTSVGGWAVGRWRTLDIVRVCLLVTALLTAGMSFSGSAIHLMVFAVLTGIANGIMTPAVNVLITRLIPLKLRGLAFGIKVGAAPLASSLAGLGAWAAANFDFPWRATYWFGAGLSVAVVLGTFCLGLPKKRITNMAKPAKAPPLNRRRHNSLVLLAFGGLLGASGTGVLPPFLVDSLINDGMNAGRAASVLAFGSAIGVVSRVLVGALSDRWPRPIKHLNAVAIMLSVAGVCMGALGMGRSEPVLLIATLIFFALGWSWPGLVHYAVLVTHSESPALATTYMQMGTFMGSVLGPLGFGLIADYGSFTTAWMIAAISVLFSAAFLSWGSKRLSRDIGPTQIPGLTAAKSEY